MQLTSPTIIKELLAKHQTKASKSLGQNFLIDKNVLRKIIEASNIKSTDTILEVGPGIGVLTQELAKDAQRVIAIEKDATMCEILKETLADFKNIEVINDDILEISNFKFQISNYKVVANIPYYLTSPLIRKFLESENPPQEIILMIQKEVAQRICAKTPKMNLLAVSVQFYAEPKIISYVTKNCFWPAPKIDSAIIKIHPLKYREAVILPTAKLFDRVNLQKKYDVDPNLFFKIVKAGFSQPRKQLGSNLTRMLKIEKEGIAKWLKQNNINATQRAETLSIEDWKNLSKTSCI